MGLTGGFTGKKRKSRQSTPGMQITPLQVRVKYLLDSKRMTKTATDTFDLCLHHLGD